MGAGRQQEAMAALQEAERLKAQIDGLGAPQPAAAPAPAPARAPAKPKKKLSAAHEKAYDDFETRIKGQAEQALRRKKHYAAGGQIGARDQAQAYYEQDMKSLERLQRNRAACVTKLPKHKERRAYTLESKQMALADDQLEIAVMGASKLDKDTLLEVKLGWPDSDRPQVHKSATAKSSQTLPDYKSVRFMIDRDDGRKGFIHKLERRTLVQFGPRNVTCPILRRYDACWPVES